LARVRALQDHRDETIAALRFRLAELSQSALERSVATATAFVNDPANDLLSAPSGRSTSVSPLPADPVPAALPSPPAARPSTRLTFGDGLLSGPAPALGRAPRSDLVPPPPWAPGPQP
jgi:hypothetical protein